MIARRFRDWIRRLAAYESLFAQTLYSFGPMFFRPELIPNWGPFLPIFAIGWLGIVYGLSGWVAYRLTGGNALSDAPSRRDLRAPEERVSIVFLLLSTAVSLVPLFSSIYWVLSVKNPAHFSGPLSRMDAIYVAVATFTTTGFGDVVPVSHSARAYVTLQMAAGFLLITFVISVAASRMWKPPRKMSLAA